MIVLEHVTEGQWYAELRHVYRVQQSGEQVLIAECYGADDDEALANAYLVARAKNLLKLADDFYRYVIEHDERGAKSSIAAFIVQQIYWATGQKPPLTSQPSHVFVKTPSIAAAQPEPIDDPFGIGE